MGCLCRDPKSKNWYWAWRDADGRRLKTSTMIPAQASLRKEAEEVGRSFETIDEVARRDADVDGQLRKIIADVLKKVGKPPLDDPTLSQWLDRWLAGQRGAVSEATLRRYDGAVGMLRRILGQRQNARLCAVTSADIQRFRDTLRAEGRSAKTTNLLLSVIRAALKVAVRDDLLERDPGRSVRYLKVVDTEKIVFSPGEVARLVAAAEGEWRTLILCAYFTGQRLSDLIRLTWADVDLDEHRIRFFQKKTGKWLKTPIHAELAEYLLALPTSDSAAALLFPELSQLKTGGSNGLSRTFSALMEKAGVGNAIAREREGKSGRSTAARSFHVLRHSHISSMMNADVPAEIRQRISGHSSTKIHAGYSHAEWETLDRAVQSIDRLPKGS